MNAVPPIDPVAIEKRISSGVFITATVITALCCLSNIGCAFLIHRFIPIFKDMCGGQKLPVPTVFVINAQLFLLFLACFWLLATIAIACWKRQSRIALSLILTLFLLSFVQQGLVVIALFKPLTVTIQKLQSS